MYDSVIVIWYIENPVESSFVDIDFTAAGTAAAHGDAFTGLFDLPTVKNQLELKYT